MYKKHGGSLKIKVSLVPEEETFGEWAAPPDMFSMDIHPLPVSKPVIVKGRLYRVGGSVYFGGECKGNLSLTCSRCLVGYEHVIEADVTAVFMPEGAGVPARQDMNITDEDIGAQYYLGEEIDLYEPVRDQLALSAPMRPLCKESCKGLCPVCGGDLNKIDCKCERGETDPRLVALKKIKFD